MVSSWLNHGKDQHFGLSTESTDLKFATSQLQPMAPWHHEPRETRSSAKLTEAKRVALETEEVRKKRVATLVGGIGYI